MIYFYYGENDFARRRAVDALVQKFSTEFGADSITKIDASEIEAQNLISEIVNINMFAPQRLMILSSLEENKSAWTAFAQNLGRIPDDTEIIVAAKAPDKRTKAFKELSKSAKTQEFKLLKGRDLSDWVMQEFHLRRVEFKTDAIDELVAATAGDQWRLAAEIAKLALLDAVVTVEKVRQFVEPNLEANAFIIVEQAFGGQKSRALAELAKLKQFEDPNKFFGLLSSQIFALAAAIHADGHANVAAELKIHPFQLSKMGDLARRLGDSSQQKQRLKKALEILAKTDAKLKLSRPNVGWTLIELAIGTV